MIHPASTRLDPRASKQPWDDSSCFVYNERTITTYCTTLDFNRAKNRASNVRENDELDEVIHLK